MKKILLTPSEQGLVVFRIRPAMPYRMRVGAALASVVAGLAWQVAALSLWPGIVLVLAGNLFLLVRGYHNRIDLGNFKASAEWRPATVEKIREIRQLDLKMKKWDRSLLDVTNRMGCLVFVAMAGLLILGISAGLLSESPAPVIVAVNIGVLLLPHWVTGVRSILTRPKLMLKIDAFLRLHEQIKEEVAGDKLEFSLLLEGKGTQEVPSDLRCRFIPQGAQAGFLGLQGQMAVNEVQGKSYLYFYVVAIAEPGYGLANRLGEWAAPKGLVLEPATSGPVEVLVLRQATTKNSGYSTDEARILSIFRCGAAMAKRVALAGSPQ